MAGWEKNITNVYWNIVKHQGKCVNVYSVEIIRKKLKQNFEIKNFLFLIVTLTPLGIILI